MPNDRETAELISRSLSGMLSPDKERALQQSISDSRRSAQYRDWSRLIQDSLSDVARRIADGEDGLAPGLPEDARQRLKDSVRQELLKQSGQSIPDAADRLDAGVPDVPPPGSPESAELRQMTSRFSILRQLGAGPLGVVWLARDEKLKRTVALKELSSEAAEFPRAWQRFCREAEITGYLEHPNVVPLYQFGTDSESGQPFYAMRFVGKRTLAEAIQDYHERRHAGEDTTMDLHKLLTAFLGVCQAVAYAHSRGVIHRDLKPENVALDSFGQVIVLDWGLARLTEEFETGHLLSGDISAADSRFEQTIAGEVIGTPLYMAPEQAVGDQDRIDERTDVYGLGAVLFTMLTGQAPHADRSRDDREQSVSVEDLLQRIASQPSPDPLAVRPDLPVGLAMICQRALKFHQHSRYQSAAELADAVERWMAGRTQRRQLYGSMQSEGRELRTNLMNFLRSLERNTRFMASLPPIQGIIDCLVHGDDRDDLSTWRSRLAVIYRGLLRTNTDFAAVTYCQVDGDQYRQVVRLERQRRDASSVRAVPASRLESGPLSSCHRQIMDGHPDDVLTSLLTRCASESRETDTGLVVSAVPVFDEKSEDPFGFVMIEASLTHVVDAFLRHRLQHAGQAFILNNNCEVLIRVGRDGSCCSDLQGQAMGCLCSQWPQVLPVLRERGEYVDDRTHTVYATRVDLIPGRTSLAIVLLADDGSAAASASETQ